MLLYRVEIPYKFNKWYEINKTAVSRCMPGMITPSIGYISPFQDELSIPVAMTSKMQTHKMVETKSGKEAVMDTTSGNID